MSFIMPSCVVLLLLVTVSMNEAATATSLNDHPVIGILTLPQCSSRLDVGQCIVSSYVKFVEAAGARVVPVPYDLEADQMVDLLQQVNGVLLTGGNTLLKEGTPFFNAIETIVDFTLASNRIGDPFPLLGICQGFEAIAAATAGTSILTHFEAKNLLLPLEFVSGSRETQMFTRSRAESSRVHRLLQGDDPLTFNQHELGVSVEDFHRQLAPHYRLIALNDDRLGQTFVSAFEGRKEPIFAVQFHPEKPLFEWSSTMNISHSSEAIVANRWFADVFVDAARSSPHRFWDSADLSRRLIYNYIPVYTGADNGYIQQIYSIGPNPADKP